MRHIFLQRRGLSSPAIVDEMFEVVDGCEARVRLVAARGRQTIRCCLRRELRNVRPGGELLRAARSTKNARTRERPLQPACRSRLPYSPAHANVQTARRSFKVNSSNRFSALAEAALQSVGHSSPDPHDEARFPSDAAEQSFVLSTRPAVVRPNQFISSPTRARRTDGVAPDARYLQACARH